MRIKLAYGCLFGGVLLSVSSVSVNVQREAAAAALLAPSVIKVALAHLPTSTTVFDAPMAKPLIPDVARESLIDAPKDPGPPNSLERARAALAESEAPALSKDEICTNLVAVAQKNELPVGFLTNLIWQESRFNGTAISRVGAMGIAQFMPDTADSLGLDAFNGREALPASARLLRTLHDRFGNLGLAAAAYNAGPKRVLDWLQQRSGLPQETRDYVSVITGKPVEQWRNTKSNTVVFNVPRVVPCHRTEQFVAVERMERAEQQQKVAEERRAMERKMAEERRALGKAREAIRLAARQAKTNKKHKIIKIVTASR
jgi:hypothetical protein